MTRELTVAVGAYDRTLPLMAGLVKIDGVNARFVTAPLEEIFARAFDERAYDVTELSASNYIYITATDDCPYVALPVYPSRAFRHSAVYIRTDRGISGPRDLAGRLVGVREYSMTAALVARGVLEDEYGLASRDVRWRYGPADATDSQPIVRVRPRGVELEPLGAPGNLSDALAEGAIDALVAYKPPPCFIEEHPKVRRLFEDYRAVEQDYAQRTGSIPIMHFIGVRREIAEKEPALCLAICRGFDAARRYAAHRLSEMQAPFTLLAWGADDLERTKGTLGPDFWRYGVAGNERALANLCRYSWQQGLAPRELAIEELFVPATLEWRP
jgi:4,5-dihydroxyphthalate decarboxylase